MSLALLEILPVLVEILLALVEISFAKAFLIASLLTSAEPDKLVIAEALVEISLALVDILVVLVEMSEALEEMLEDNWVLIASLFTSAELLNAASCTSDAYVESIEAVNVSMLSNLPSCTAAAALLEVTKPPNAVSFSVSTELIKVTISAKESLSAWEPVKIASILAFSVSILLSNPFSIDTLWVWAEPLNEDIADVLLDISDARAVLIASLLTSAEELNAVMSEALVEILPATVL